MSTKFKGKNHFNDLHTSRLSFWMISLMHDNPLLPRLKDPYRLLEAAGLIQGQKVMEVGCGPGFFTIPAAKIVGDAGIVYATDVNPLAIARVEQKIRSQGIRNVKPMLINAASSGLPDSSIDLCFVFGLRYISGGLSRVLSEMHRILKPGGLLSFEKTTGSAAGLIEDVERAGFVSNERKGRIFIFVNKHNT
ncbi:MAG: class I SAM-dependent methyltransferase [Dehalococcoidia bacterium]|nr:class I SAM-dependent methyltransferase [Dehalococcoidia bacterium]